MNEKTITQPLYIKKDVLKHWENMLKREDIDYDNEKWKAYSNVIKWTAKFSNGFEIDLKVNTNDTTDHDLFSEAVLFDEDGCELTCTDVQYDLEGEWNLYYEGTTYSINVIGV